MAKRVVSVEITEDAVRAAEVELGRTPVLRTAGEVRLPGGAAKDSEVIDRDAVAVAMRQLWTEGRFTGKNVTIGVASRRILVREHSTPLRNAVQIRQALPFQVQDLLPVPVEQAVLDFHPTADDGEHVHGMLVAAVSETIEELIATLAQAKLHTDAVDLTAFGLSRVLGAIAPAGRTALLIDIGEHLTQLVVAVDGVPRFLRVIPVDIVPVRTADVGAPGLVAAGQSIGGPGEAPLRRHRSRQDGPDAGAPGAATLTPSSSPPSSIWRDDCATRCRSTSAGLVRRRSTSPGCRGRARCTSGCATCSTTSSASRSPRSRRWRWCAPRPSSTPDSPHACSPPSPSPWRATDERQSTPRPAAGRRPRVNLLPASELERRTNTATARRWAGIVLIAVAVVAALVVGLQGMHLLASARLASEQNTTQQLTMQMAQLAPVSQSLSARSAIETQRTEAMSGDLAWRPVLDTLASGIPAGSSITGYALTAGPAPAGDDPAATPGVSGTVTLSSATPIDLVSATAKLRTLEPVMSVDVQVLTRDEDVFTYTVTVVLDQTVYTGDFAPEKKEK
ncbi:pilus assembly protein PilM [Microbacterium sp. KUDC0406]|uniref:pilus assembly protein PilM n=1 Tax=Microbacterium sp. KUDC0406 TaxID=2909588 RepID=UPI001F2D89C6|nr:pilus assembly protein PilM [Microbacterium sp. KUDC0406]UJP10276.1 pilus assembly protein PilM [Microbacterium sp. KUDC0406]